MILVNFLSVKKTLCFRISCLQCNDWQWIHWYFSNSVRCVVVNDPLKQELKSNESWQVMLQRLRTLLIQAFNRHLVKYEEGMRNLREIRNEPGWKFTNFFLVQVSSFFSYRQTWKKLDHIIYFVHFLCKHFKESCNNSGLCSSVEINDKMWIYMMYLYLEHL